MPISRRPALLTAFFLFAIAPSPGFVRQLTFEQRVQAQSAIERVYYSHQSGKTRRFEEAVPRGVLERKVTTYLRQGDALDRFWHRPITSEMLRAEVERMSRRSRMPGRLQELFAALGDDPFLIQECLARPALAARLAGSCAAFDERLHQAERERALQFRRGMSRSDLCSLPGDIHRTEVDIRPEGDGQALPPAGDRAEEAAPGEGQDFVVSRREFDRWRSRLPAQIGEAGPAREEREAFVIPVLLESDERHLRAAFYSIPKRDRSDVWLGLAPRPDPSATRPAAAGEALPAIGPQTSSCACGSADFWDNGSLDDAPEPRYRHSAVWTGSQMIIWGGEIYLSTDTGARYDPATDTWSPTSTLNAPSPRIEPTMFWTGDRVLLWGGMTVCEACVPFPVNTGATYDPVTDTWTHLSQTGAPPHLDGYSAVWTGSEMIVWGGLDRTLGTYSNKGYRLNPANNTWTGTSVAGAASGRRYASAVWTGAEMLVWGGSNTSLILNTGARYDPAGDSWTPMNSAGGPPASQASAAWTGDRMLVWTGAAGGLYDPGGDAWQSISTAGAPPGLEGQSAVWSGSEMIVWGGFKDPDYFNVGARYSPATDTWSATSLVNAPSGRWYHTAVWAGDEMIVWGGDDGVLESTGGRYNPATDTWVPTSTGAGPSPRTANAVWTGSRMLVWGGAGYGGAGFTYSGTGGQYDPIVDSWSSLSTSGAPSPRIAPLVWTGDRMIVWGGYDGTARLATGGRYDPIGDSWSPTSPAGAPAARSSHGMVWSGQAMLVWGGSDGSNSLSSGGRYDPVGDSWTPMNAAGAPPGVKSPLAFWTGNRLLVWGGTNAGSPYGVNTGGLYDPVYDVWRPTSASAPTPRYGDSGVWTGNEMIIWGGIDVSTYVDSGGRYDPESDLWTSTSQSGVPQARYLHSAVWTGTRMVIWGGFNNVFESADPYLSTGGIYDPVSNSWSALSNAASPAGRASAAAVWSGERMLVWGGTVGGYSGSGGSYCGIFPPHFYQDNDGDGYGNSGTSVVSCSQPPGYSALGGDCSDSNIAIWGTPSEVLNVGFSDSITLGWSAPAAPGAASLLYDVLRSANPADFTGGATCLVPDSPLLSATDTATPASGATLNYLVRPQSGCPSGSGPLGKSSAGVPRTGLSCP
jgi:N-acetylneuraminic acid mutarotase